MLDHAAAIEACARGDRDALRRLYEAEAAALIGVATRILRRRDLAEEAVHEGFIAVWRAAARFDRARGSGRGWLFAVVRNRALTMLRDGARETAIDADALDALREEALGAWEALPPEAGLRRCMAALDAPKREAILLAYVTGLTHGEIAGRMAAPLGTVKAWVRRGLAALRECLA